jgi:hypothetical protein
VIEAAPEEIPPVAEAVPEEIVTPPVEEIAVAAEIAPLVEEVVPPAIPEPEYPEEEPVLPVAEIPTVEEAPPVPAPEIAIPAPPEIPTVEPPPPAEPFAAERAYLKEHPRDHKAWLALARALWQADERQEALEAYTRLIRAGKLLENVIPDLESYLKQWPGADVQRVLGDAYMKDGRLQEALDIYRRALETL